MFTPCLNSTCPRAGWCKRISYKFSPGIRETYGQFMECSNATGWHNYVKNKAREIYEREHPDDILSNEESKQEKHSNNNRESGMREDVETDIGASGPDRTEVSVEPDGGDVVLERSGGRDNTPSNNYIDFEEYLRGLISNDESLRRLFEEPQQP